MANCELTTIRLQNVVIDIEVENGAQSPTVDPSVRVILVGHSMGGIVAADTYIAIASDSPIPYSHTAAPYPSTTTNTTATSTSAPPSSSTSKRAESPPHTFMFPYIQGVLAFDTPYLGIAPGVVANSAETKYQTASSAYTALSSAASAFGFGGGAAAASGPKGIGAAKKLTAGPESAKEALSASADAAAVPAWQKWGKYAMWTGAVGAVAAGGVAGYNNRDSITYGLTWVSSHLEFVGCLLRGEELKSRVSFLASANAERGVGFCDIYTTLGAAGTKSGTTVAGGFVEIGAKDGARRTFCNLPQRPDWTAFFVPSTNDKATDEVQAHMSMFLPKENPGFYALGDSAKSKIVAWVDQGWYESGQRKPDAKGAEALDGEEAVVV